MATILQFKLPTKPPLSSLATDTIISISVNDVMLIIHEAIHGTEEEYRPRNLHLATQLLDELSSHISCKGEEDYLVLSRAASSIVFTRYPDIYEY